MKKNAGRRSPLCVNDNGEHVRCNRHDAPPHVASSWLTCAGGRRYHKCLLHAKTKNTPRMHGYSCWDLVSVAADVCMDVVVGQ